MPPTSTVIVSFDVQFEMPPGGMPQPAIQSAARIALIMLAQAYYDNDEKVVLGEGGLRDMRIDIVNGF
jgi:hypothetical protein